jgi:hypothetical protein
MGVVQPVLDAVMEYFRSGFYSVNGVKGLLIAIIAAYYMHEWRRVFFVALGAVAAHVVLDVMLPVIVSSAAFAMPPLVEPGYWQNLLKLYAGYLIVISVFFLVKRLLQGGRH